MILNLLVATFLKSTKTQVKLLFTMYLILLDIFKISSRQYVIDGKIINERFYIFLSQVFESQRVLDTDSTSHFQLAALGCSAPRGQAPRAPTCTALEAGAGGYGRAAPAWTQRVLPDYGSPSFPLCGPSKLPDCKN